MQREAGRCPCLGVQGGGSSSGYPGERHPRSPGLEGLAKGSEEPGEDDPCWRRVGLNVTFLPRHSAQRSARSMLCSWTVRQASRGRFRSWLLRPRYCLGYVFHLVHAGGQRLGYKIPNYGHGE